MITRTAAARLAAFVLAVLPPAVAGAQVQYQTGFEQPTFTPGLISSAPLTPGQGAWQIDDVPANVSIVAGEGFAGGQALKMTCTTTGPAGGWTWWDPLNINTAVAGNKKVSIAFRMKINPPAPGSNPSGGYGVDIFASDFNYIASIQVAGASGQLFIQNGFAGFQPTTVVVPDGEWHRYQIDLDFTTTDLETYTVKYDGNPVSLAAGGTVVAANRRTGIIGDVDFRHNQQAAANDSAVFDDLIIAVGSIPPPCPVDFNNDSVKSPADIFAFLTGYFTRDPRADFNASGTFEPADIFAFLSAYFSTTC